MNLKDFHKLFITSSDFEIIKIKIYFDIRYRSEALKIISKSHNSSRYNAHKIASLEQTLYVI